VVFSDFRVDIEVVVDEHEGAVPALGDTLANLKWSFSTLFDHGSSPEARGP
jgi:hypothetical protein